MDGSCIVAYICKKEDPRAAHRDTLVETACRLCSGSGMGLILCTAAQSSEVVNSLTTEAFHPPLHPSSSPLSLPVSLPALGGCQFLTLEAPLIAGKAPCIYNGYIYSKNDVRSPFVKPPWSCQIVLVTSQYPALHNALIFRMYENGRGKNGGLSSQ
jgi:hypothetical protein